MSKRDSLRGARFNAGRRRLIKGMAATGALALSGCGGDVQPGDGNGGPGPQPGGNLPPLPDPAQSGIDHIVVVMMENRSYDHYLGWAPGGDGIQEGLQYPDKNGDLQSTFRLSTDPAYGWQGCGFADPDHSYDGGRVELNGGAMDGFLLTDSTEIGDHFPIGYYTKEDLPFNAGVADNWTICDRYFCSILSQTFPNRFYMHAGQTDRNDNALTTSSLTTIWDRLADAGRSARFYFSDLPIIGLFGGPKHVGITREFGQFLIDAQLGLLPDVSYIDPNFGGSVGEGVSISMDDHPRADIRWGQAFLNRVYDALRASPQWDRTLLIINYDEWGGFYDHVAPPFAPVTPEEFDLIGNDGRLGFRVPCYLVGPRARRNHVSHVQFDHNSILNFICWRFGMPTLGARGETSLNLAHALDFSSPPQLDAPTLSVPIGPFGSACGTPLGTKSAVNPYAKHESEWQALYDVVRKMGYPVR